MSRERGHTVENIENGRDGSGQEHEDHSQREDLDTGAGEVEHDSLHGQLFRRAGISLSGSRHLPCLEV